MAKKVAQFRYYGIDSNKNFPKGITKAKLQSGSIFNNCYPITQLGIQALPGTEFYLNGNNKTPIIIGSTGIYELSLEGVSEITHLAFDRYSLSTIETTPTAYLIVDIIYDTED